MTPVEFLFVTPQGVPVANTAFEIQLSKSSHTDLSDGVVLPRPITAMSDADGKATINLWPNASLYYVTMYDSASSAGLSYKFYVPVLDAGNTSIRLQDIVVDSAVSTLKYDEAALLLIQTVKANTLGFRDDAKASEVLALSYKAAAKASELLALDYKDAAFVSKGLAEAAVTLAGTKVSEASVFAGTASTKAGEASASAAQAVVTKNLTADILTATIALAEKLPVISKSLHSGAIVKSIIYDTSKDSDGGAWRKRCTDKSWYTEPLGGVAWLGQAGTATAAWALSGAVTGSYFQNTTDGKFYSLGASSPAVTECFRGNVREFPAVVGIVVESSRVVIYDLTQVGTPMWMVFKCAVNTMIQMVGATTCVAASNGMLTVGGVSSYNPIVKFIQDIGYFHTTTNNSGYLFKGTITDRNSTLGFTVGYPVGGVVHATVNDVAIAVLDNAPVDPATGLPVPTIAVATAGGVSVIKQDGTVVNITGQAGSVGAVVFQPDGRIMTHGAYQDQVITLDIPVSNVLYTAFKEGYGAGGLLPLPPTAIGAVKLGRSVLGGDLGLTPMKRNPANATKTMFAAITNTYNSGWMPGDIRGAYLADTVAETITGTELVTNGTFTTDASGWTPVNATLSVVANALHIVGNGGGFSSATQNVPTVMGKTYRVSGAVTANSGASLPVAFQVAGANYSDVQLAAGITFVATASTMQIGLQTGQSTAGPTIDFDNISVKLAEPDRSVKNNGLIVNGTLTKTAVASGAGLVEYSGFNATSYLSQPYSNQLDFGVGDFTYYGYYFFATSTSHAQVIFQRGVGAGGIVMQEAGGNVYLYMHNGTSFVQQAVFPVTGNERVAFAITRISGVLSIYLRGVLFGSYANTLTLTSPELPQLMIGTDPTLASFATNGKFCLLRASASGVTADQVAHIYRTELPLFQPNAQCTIAGTSTAVTALAYDDVTDLLHVGTSYGRSGFKDLLRVDSEATTTGALTSLSAQGGTILTGGTSAKVYVPAKLLRDELQRQDAAKRALGKAPVFFDFTATASQTAFALPKGYTTKGLYKNGVLMREATTGVYWTRSSDGFAETCTLSVGATVSDWISIMAVRS